jgi:nicotinamidase-related amidase
MTSPPTESAPMPSLSSPAQCARLQSSECLLLIVDVQERLAPHIVEQGQLVARCEALLSVASLLQVPCFATEHSPAGIGPLVARLRSRFEPARIFEKTSFGALDHPEFAELLGETGRRQCIVAGMEAHVCVLQTALGLRRADYDVFLVADAVGSRAMRQDDRAHALQRMSDAGVVLVGTETAVFELTGSAMNPAFRSVLAVVKGLP